MKKILLALLLLALPVMTKATEQAPEKILFEGKIWNLMHCPIELDTMLSDRLQELVPKDVILSTDCYRGYIGEWELKDDRLFLRNIRIDNIGQYVDKATLERIFEPYCTNDGIFASWVTDTLRIGRGECISYSNYQQESLLTIQAGSLTNKKEYHNYVKNGVSWDDIEESLRPAFTARGLLREDDIYTLVAIEDVVLDDEANFVDCNLKIEVGKNKILTDQNNPDIINLKNILKQQSPWSHSYINGEIIPHGCWLYIQQGTFPA